MNVSIADIDCTRCKEGTLQTCKTGHLFVQVILGWNETKDRTFWLRCDKCDHEVPLKVTATTKL